MQKSAGTYFARTHVQGDGARSQERLADCVQNWYTDRDPVVRFRASQLEAHPRSSARAGLNLSPARLLPKKAAYGSQIASYLYTFSVYFSVGLTSQCVYMYICTYACLFRLHTWATHKSRGDYCPVVNISMYM